MWYPCRYAEAAGLRARRTPSATHLQLPCGMSHAGKFRLFEWNTNHIYRR